MNYFIILRLKDDQDIEVGKLGRINFKKGYYIYVGSAKRGFSKRIRRHLRKNKKLWWHIDYLSVKADVIDVFKSEADEHKLAELASKLYEGIKGFGSSDCKCYTHLFYSPNYPKEFVNEAKKLKYIVAERLNYEEL